MEIVTIETPSLGDRTYIAHDGDAALVIDPQRDIDRVLAALDEHGVHPTHIAETHVHNDYVSGGLVLARVTGATLVHAAAEAIDFDHHAVADGDTFDVGQLTVEAVHTPGHTPHHLSYVVRDGDETVVFTGGSLLLGTVGRTDLISEDATDELTRAQFRSARRLADSLPDDTRVLPTHGFGSFCASASSDEESDGTLATEREVNIALTTSDVDTFVDTLLSGLAAYPAYYAYMDPRNRAGGGPVDLSPPAPVDPVELARRIHRGEWVVDLRRRRAFASEHLVGTVGIELADAFSTYLGWLIPWSMPVTLLATDPDEIAEAQRQLVRIGIDRPAGASVGEGPGAWAPDHDRGGYRVVTFDDLATGPVDGVVLDVRRHDERADGAVAESVHVPIDELLDRLDGLPTDTLWVHCASGFRASIAASLLARAGREVVLVDDDVATAAHLGLLES